MCGRFTQRWTWKQLRDAAQPFWHVTPGAEDLVPRFNVAPSQPARVVRASESEPELAEMRWGFPRFEGGKRAGEVINARSETAARIPMFRDAADARRCLVPISGFYEWQKLGDGSKQPWYLTPSDAPVCFLAGLWQPGEAGPEYVVLTHATPERFEPAIHHRMPGVITPDRAADWLDPGRDASDALALTAPFGGPRTFEPDAWRVSRRVNSPANDNPGLIDRAKPEPGLFGD